MSIFLEMKMFCNHGEIDPGLYLKILVHTQIMKINSLDN